VPLVQQRCNTLPFFPSEKHEALLSSAFRITEPETAAGQMFQVINQAVLLPQKEVKAA
jgi:hypothetical protein